MVLWFSGELGRARFTLDMMILKVICSLNDSLDSKVVGVLGRKKPTKLIWIMFVGNIEYGQVAGSEKRRVSGELVVTCALGETTRGCVTLLKQSPTLRAGGRVGRVCGGLGSKGSYSSMVVHWKQNPSWAQWPESKCSTWTQTQQSWAGAGRALSQCKVLLLPACCTGILLISWREFREDQERGGLQNVPYSKTQSFMCKVSMQHFFLFFFFSLCLELCSNLTRTEGSTVTFLGRRSDCVITGFFSLCKTPWCKSGKEKGFLSSETNVCISSYWMIGG